MRRPSDGTGPPPCRRRAAPQARSALAARCSWPTRKSSPRRGNSRPVLTACRTAARSTPAERSCDRWIQPCWRVARRPTVFHPVSRVVGVGAEVGVRAGAVARNGEVAGPVAPALRARGGGSGCSTAAFAPSRPARVDRSSRRGGCGCPTPGFAPSWCSAVMSQIFGDRRATNKTWVRRKRAGSAQQLRGAPARHHDEACAAPRRGLRGAAARPARRHGEARATRSARTSACPSRAPSPRC